MERREFLKTAGAGTIAAAASLTIGAPAVIASTKKIRWKATSFWNPKIKIMFDTVKDFCQNVKEMSDGQLDIKLYGGGELVPPFGAFDAVSQGTMQMGTGSPYFWAGKNPAFNWFGSIPFGMNAQSINAWFYEGNGMNLMTELYDQFNLVPRVIGNSGVQMGGWYNKKINSLEDFKGLKMRIGSIAGKVLSEVGVTTVMLPPSEIFPSLERGVVDAAEFVGPVHDILLGLYKVAPYYYTPGWHEPGPVLDAFFNKEAYNALPKHLQRILDIAAADTNIRALAAFDARSSIALDKLIKEHNVKVEVYPDDIMVKLKEVSKKVVAEEAKKDPFAQKVHDDYIAFQKQVGVWGNMSEKVYWNTMA
ncbi:TRAP transporter substrate-binding protein [Desulfopila sp. IMCC35008]|uniref:TRAP transporter substrate-binding protein n=1 Tax=Desulfopila sp. IMCC35008 TaxID=2653858 RepID=UPI0013D72570|nr:TRAP transporter substrate-binding protein [Desulfopila sp. IMCC35008]